MPSTFHRCARAALLAAAMLATAAQAYVVIPQGGNNYNKWGPTLAAGTPGGVVTWGFMAAGTAGSAYCSDACPGNSVLGLPNFYANPASSNATSTISLLDLQPTLQAAFDKWSAVANVRFQYVGIDNSGLAINDPAAIVPMIRVGAFSFNNAFSGAVGYSPPPNGGTGAGDLLFNTAVGFQLASGAEGSALQQFPAGGGFYMNDIRGLALHEIGHTLGLLHSADASTVMCGNPTANCSNLDHITQQLRADDIAGAQFLYGVAIAVPEPAANWMALVGPGRHRLAGPPPQRSHVAVGFSLTSPGLSPLQRRRPAGRVEHRSAHPLRPTWVLPRFNWSSQHRDSYVRLNTQ